MSLSLGGVSDFANLSQILANTGQVKQTIMQLSSETSTGYLSTSYAGLGQGASQALDLSTEIAANTALQDTTATGANIQAVAQTALSQISTIAGGFIADGITLQSNPSSISTIAGAAQGALQQVAALLDTKVGDVYIFAGQDSSTPPVPNPGSVTQSAFYAAIQSAVAGLGTNGASATQAATLAIASPGGTSPFSASLDASGTQSEVDLGNGTRVALAPLANANSDALSSGAGTTSTGSYTRDILLSLASIGSLTPGQGNDPNWGSFVQGTVATLQGAIGALTTDQGALGNRQKTVSTAQSDLTATNTTLATQLSNVQDADLPEVATKLAQAQTQLQASYQILSSLGSLSLVKFI